jgi:hypothetical protein
VVAAAPQYAVNAVDEAKKASINKNMLLKLLIIISSILLIEPSFAQVDPPVKKSSTGICHAQGTTYYAQTKTFTAYKTLDECLKAGGRMPKR